MSRTPKLWPPDPRKTPLYLALMAAIDASWVGEFDMGKYDAVRTARVAYLASVAP
jgi:hypothetical protein